MNKKNLNTEIKKNGFLYKRVYMTETAAIYKQTDGDKTIAWEVFKRKWNRPHPKSEDQETMVESFPSNEDFGKRAWSCRAKDAAIQKLNSLTGK